MTVDLENRDRQSWERERVKRKMHIRKRIVMKAHGPTLIQAMNFKLLLLNHSQERLSTIIETSTSQQTFRSDELMSKSLHKNCLFWFALIVRIPWPKMRIISSSWLDVCFFVTSRKIFIRRMNTVCLNVTRYFYWNGNPPKLTIRWQEKQ